jgi:hypothetical protein
MPLLIAALLLLFPALAAQAAGPSAPAPFHPRWLQCEREGDCTLAEGRCGMVASVNKNYIDAWRADVPQSKEKAGCPSSSKETRRSLMPTCAGKTCGFLIKNTTR